MSRRVNPDTLPVLIIAAGLTSALGAVSFLLSFTGLAGTAPAPIRDAGQAWAVPVVIDGAIVVYTLAVLIKRRRGETARFQWAALVTFTALSAAANAAHAWDTSAQDSSAILGTLIAAVAPLAVFAATHTLADLIVEPVPVAEDAHVAESVPLEDDPVPARLLPRADRDAVIRAKAAEGLGPRRIEAETGIPKSTAARVLSTKG